MAKQEFKDMVGNFSGNENLLRLQCEFRKVSYPTTLEPVKAIIRAIRSLCSQDNKQQLHSFFKMYVEVFEYQNMLSTEVSGNHKQHTREMREHMHSTANSIHEGLEEIARDLCQFTNSIEARLQAFGEPQKELMEEWQRWFTVVAQDHLDKLAIRVKESKAAIKNLRGRECGTLKAQDVRTQIGKKTREKIQQLDTELNHQEIPGQKCTTAIIAERVGVTERHVRRTLNKKPGKQ